MKFEANWKYKTLENLEKDIWPTHDLSNESALISKCHQLRKVQLVNLNVEDLRIMITQDIGLKYLIPTAVEILIENVMAEGDFYPGDLLHSLISRDGNYWKNDKKNWKLLCDIVNNKVDQYEDDAEPIMANTIRTFEIFQKIHES